MRQTIETKHEGVLAGFIFVLWLMAVIFPPLQVNIFAPVNDLTPGLYWLAALYLLLNGLALVYSLYMLVRLARASRRRKHPGTIGWRMALYVYAVIGVLIAIHSAAQAIL